MDNYKQIIKRIAEGEAFKGNTMTGYRMHIPLAGYSYSVYSYGAQIGQVIVKYATKEAFFFRNERKYSVTTSKHQNYTWRGFTALHATLLNDLGYTIHTIFSLDKDAIAHLVHELENGEVEVTA